MKQINSTKLSFKNQDLYVGIDVHKKQWTICVTHMKRVVYKNTSINPSAKVLNTFLNRRFPDGRFHAVYEAGFSGFEAAREMKRLGIDCIVTHAADVPTKQKERMNKNDKVDAKKLSRSLGNHELDAIYIPDKVCEEFRYLARYRYRLVKDQTRQKNRIKSALFQFGVTMPPEFEDRRWSGKFIEWLASIPFETEYAKFAFDEQIGQLKQVRELLVRVLKKMKTMALKVGHMSPIYKYLLSVPGIGPLTAVSLLTEIMDIKRFGNSDQLVAFVGLSPLVQSSDEKSVQLGLTPRRNKYLRSMLVEAAWKAAASDPALTMKYGKLSRRMHNNKAIVRIAKMLLCRVRHVWKNKQFYVEGVVH